MSAIPEIKRVFTRDVSSVIDAVVAGECEPTPNGIARTLGFSTKKGRTPKRGSGDLTQFGHENAEYIGHILNAAEPRIRREYGDEFFAPAK